MNISLRTHTSNSPFVADPAYNAGCTPNGQTQSANVLCVISDSGIFRTCVCHCLATMMQDVDVRSHANLTEWRNSAQAGQPGIVLFCVKGEMVKKEQLTSDLVAMREANTSAKIVVVSDEENVEQMMAALSAGANGYLTMNTELDIFVSAIRLVSVGGTFIPANSLGWARNAEPEATAEPSTGVFSRRQLDVLELARQGDPNKIIAYKLNMSEATAKIHIRNMMRKIKARNRTELIFKTNEMRLAA